MKSLYLMAFVILLVFQAPPSYAEEKRALVIGNAAYRFGALKNPVNDARSMAKTLRLRKLGFIVTELHNRSRKQMSKSIREFGQSINPGSVAVVYFSGHGAQYRGDNYLFPVDFNTQYEDDLPAEAISTRFVMDKLRNNHNGLNIVILDACRDNPLQKKHKSSAKGLARIDNAPPNTYTIFATGPGKVASDNPYGKNGLFTKHLVQYMTQPGLDLGGMVIETRKKVITASGNRQVPYDSGSLTRRFCFAGCESASVLTPNTADSEVTPVVKPEQAPVKPTSIQHTHNGRSHTHLLPVEGVNHQHGIQQAAKPVQPRPVEPAVVTQSQTLHSHNGRSHDHPLPASGKNHQHGGTAAPEFKEGTHYFEIFPRVLTDVAVGKVEVIELVWLGCRPCYDLEPTILEYKKNLPDYVEFKQVPAMLNPRWTIDGKLFYIAEMLDPQGDKKLVQKIFHEIHVQKNRKLSNPVNLKNFMVQQGITKEEYDRVANSMVLQAKLNIARQISLDSQAQAAPSFIINGKYRTSPGAAGGTIKTLMQIVEMLAKRESEK